MILLSLQNSIHQIQFNNENILSVNFKNSGMEIFLSDGKLTFKMKIFFRLKKSRYTMDFLKGKIYVLKDGYFYLRLPQLKHGYNCNKTN